MNIPIWLGELLSRPLPPPPAETELEPPLEVRQASPSPQGLALELNQGAGAIRFLADTIVAVRFAAPGDLELPSFARSAPAARVGMPGVTAARLENGWSVSSPALRVEIGDEGTRLRLAAAGDGELLAGRVARTDRGWRSLWALDAADRVYGLGAKTGPLNHRGCRTLVWARETIVGRRSDPLYSAVPFLLLARGGRWLGVLLDSSARAVFDLGCRTPGQMSFGPRVGALAFVLFGGPTLGDVLRQYTALTGLPPLPPRWALGHHQSRYSYADEEEVRQIARAFRRRDIPTDAVHLDIHYMDGFRVFTFHPERFPDPRRLAGDLARDGFRLVAIVDPGLRVDRRYAAFRDGLERGYFGTRPKGTLFTMKVWPGKAAFPDFYRREVREWWGSLMRAYTDADIAGLWNDMNEPSGWRQALYVGDGIIPFGEASARALYHRMEDGHRVAHIAVRNAYGHLQNEATYEGLCRLRPGERPFVLTRAAFAGTQRYAAQWTGDVLSTWSALRQSLPMILGFGLSGLPFAGSDIGGFFGDCTPELYARWIQIGALAPFCRSHTALHTHRQEPWSFGPEVEAIARAALKLRYRLLPYLYTCFWQAATTGMPVWRPLFAEFPGDDRLAAVEDQVMIGPALLAAPVVERGGRRRSVVLPPGTWFDWHTGAPVAGGRAIAVDAPLERMPLFVRSGVALPLQGDVAHTGDRPQAPLVWEVFLSPGETGSLGVAYEDDGRSFAYREGAWQVTGVTASWGDATAIVRFGPARGAYVSPRREARINLHVPGLRAVRVEGRPAAWPGEITVPHDRQAHELELEVAGAVGSA